MLHLEVRTIRAGPEVFADIAGYLRHARFVKVWDSEVCADWQLGNKCQDISSALGIPSDRVSTRSSRSPKLLTEDL